MNSTLVLKPEESAEKQKNDIDLIAIAVDVLVPFVLDNFLFQRYQRTSYEACRDCSRSAINQNAG
ncbi:MAG: hypothetical protein IPN55_02370 [Saprospiraceae bacterium]|nr:hypothetical protein [Candidatus Brachybacter algidus]